MTEKILKGYKITSWDLKSVNSYNINAKGCRQYYIGKWIETSLINRGALCVFNDINDVKQYLKILCQKILYRSPLRIFDCLYIEAKADEYNNRYNDFIKHPIFVRQGKQIFFLKSFYPRTKLAKKVKLIKEVEGI